MSRSLRLVALGALTLLGLVAAAAVAHDFYGDANAASPATTTAKMAMTSTMKMKTSTTPVTVKGLFEGPHFVELNNVGLNETRKRTVKVVGGEVKTLSVNLLEEEE